jgi:centractin
MHPVLLTEAPINPKKNREHLAQLFFETFNVPALFLSIQAVLALYASGRTTGVVLDVGDGVSHTVPVYEGFAMQNAIQRSNVAGRLVSFKLRDVTRHMELLLRKQGQNLISSAEFEVVRLIKEKACFVSMNPLMEVKDFAGKYEAYILPDGNTVKVGTERFLAPEILFNPSLVND